MLTPQFSIIIPTYNRKETLAKGARRLQTADGGSGDPGNPCHRRRLYGRNGRGGCRFRLTSPITIRYLAKPNKGPATARNCGIREAKGALLLFGDDDIIPAPTLVAEHLAWNRRYPADNFAILGHVSWSPEVHPTPFMEWLGREGVLFRLWLALLPGKEVGFEYFYSCNLSVKREFLIRNGVFDEKFRSLLGTRT